MDKNLYSQENIDNYLTNKLSTGNKKAFEEGLTKDPLLKNEIDLQADIIKSIKEARHLELKTRLNNIEITPAPSYLSYKIAASIIAILGFMGSFMYFQKDNLLKQEKVPNSYQNITLKNKSEINSSNITNPSAKEVFQNSVPYASSGTFSIKKDNNLKKSYPQKEVSLSESSPEIKSDFMEEEIHPESNLEVPSGEVVESINDLTSEVEVSILPVGDKNFHYQFYANKLYLYCDFNSQPYELIELNKKGMKNLFLHYNKSYYELKNNQVELAPLSEIKNNEIINQLELIKHK